MAELGEHADAYHGRLADLAAELGIDVIAVGELGRAYGFDDLGARRRGGARGRARRGLRPGDAVLVKASRSVGLEGIAPALANHVA